MEDRAFLVRAMLVIVPVGILAASHAQAKSPKMTDVENGERLVQALDCTTCHTPKLFGEQGPVPDPKRLLAGHPAEQGAATIPCPSSPESSTTRISTT